MQGLNEGVTIPRRPNHYGGTDSLRGAPNVPTMSQVLSSIQYICFRKTSGSNMGTPKLLLAPEPSNLVTPLTIRTMEIATILTKLTVNSDLLSTECVHR